MNVSFRRYLHGRFLGLLPGASSHWFMAKKSCQAGFSEDESNRKYI